MIFHPIQLDFLQATLDFFRVNHTTFFQKKILASFLTKNVITLKHMATVEISCVERVIKEITVGQISQILVRSLYLN